MRRLADTDLTTNSVMNGAGLQVNLDVQPTRQTENAEVSASIDPGHRRNTMSVGKLEVVEHGIRRHPQMLRDPRVGPFLDAVQIPDRPGSFRQLPDRLIQQSKPF